MPYFYRKLFNKPPRDTVLTNYSHEDYLESDSDSQSHEKSLHPIIEHFQVTPEPPHVHISYDQMAYLQASDEKSKSIHLQDSEAREFSKKAGVLREVADSYDSVRKESKEQERYQSKQHKILIS
jgi:hypothetical protein